MSFPADWKFRRIDLEWSICEAIYANGEYLSRFIPYGVWTPLVFVYGPERHEA